MFSTPIPRSLPAPYPLLLLTISLVPLSCCFPSHLSLVAIWLLMESFVLGELGMTLIPSECVKKRDTSVSVVWHHLEESVSHSKQAIPFRVSYLCSQTFVIGFPVHEAKFIYIFWVNTIIGQTVPNIYHYVAEWMKKILKNIQRLDFFNIGISDESLSNNIQQFNTGNYCKTR